MATMTHPHPNLSLPPDQLLAAYGELLQILAADEPEALQNALETTMMLPPAEADPSEQSPAFQIAQAWLGYTARSGRTNHEGRHGFSYPAHVAFDIAGAPSPRAARRVAKAAIDRLLKTQVPLGVIDGSLPDAPRINNVTVWLGSSHDDDKDVLELEEYTHPE